MKRLTKNISKKQNYCAYEVKNATYQDIYGTFSKYSDIEENVDCDLTIAIDKLGQLEDIEEKHNMSIEEMDKYITAHKQIEQELGVDLITFFKVYKESQKQTNMLAVSIMKKNGLLKK